MRTIECIILEKEGSKNGLHPHLDAHGQKSVNFIFAGKVGSKIAEIGQMSMSRVMIRISKSDAKSLINMSLDLHKASLERGKSSDDENSTETPSRSHGGP